MSLPRSVTSTPSINMAGNRHAKDKEIFSSLNTIAEITDFLFLSSLSAASKEESLKERGIKHVINVTAEAPVTEYESVQCIRIKLSDTPNAKIGIHFDMLADKIEQIRREREKVLVHCVAGVSRSATIVIAYLMKYQKMSLLDAHSLVKQRRALIRPNSGFWEDLVVYEKKLFNKNSVVMVDSQIYGKIPNIYEQEAKNMFW